MGVFDAGAAAITGQMDWPEMYGLLAELRERVKAADMPMEIHVPDGLFSQGEPHMADPKVAINDMLDEFEEHVEAAHLLGWQILEAL